MLQLLTAGPFWVFSTAALFSLRQFALPLQFLHLERYALASCTRVRYRTCPHFDQLYTHLQSFLNGDGWRGLSDTRRLQPLGSRWFSDWYHHSLLHLCYTTSNLALDHVLDRTVYTQNGDVLSRFQAKLSAELEESFKNRFCGVSFFLSPRCTKATGCEKTQ